MWSEDRAGKLVDGDADASGDGDHGAGVGSDLFDLVDGEIERDGLAALVRGVFGGFPGRDGVLRRRRAVSG